MTAIVIFLVFTGVVGVLWIGANDVRTDQMTAEHIGAVFDLFHYGSGWCCSPLKSGGIAAGRRGQPNAWLNCSRSRIRFRTQRHPNPLYACVWGHYI